MPQATFHFPAGFLWGCATAAHQVEGNNKNNNWWDWEQQPGRILQGHKSGLACDWWGGRWKEDFDRAAETGQNAHRLSVEWSRIQPSPDRWDEHALDYYRQMLRGLNNRGMTSMVTLHHFSDPLWLVEKGGWEWQETPKLFAVFARRVVEALKEYNNLWVTINEPNVYAFMGYAEGVFPPGVRDMSRTFRVMENLVRGHAAAYEAVHAVQSTARVGLAVNYHGLHPDRSWLPLDRWVAGTAHTLFNNYFPRAAQDGTVNTLFRKGRIPAAARTQDFLGLNYYTIHNVRFSPLALKRGLARHFFPEGAELSETGFLANRPEGMFESLKWAHRYGIPILVTENGVEDSDDRLRPRYLAQHIHQMWRGVNFSWPIKGYFHWSLVDNFEWERGWTQRFGLWGLDVDTQQRRRRPSVDMYAEICKLNGISSEIVARYSPEVQEKLFPV